MQQPDPFCLLCTTDIACVRHRSPSVTQENIYKAGFESLALLVEQLKNDLSLANADIHHLRNQRDYWAEEAKRLQAALDHANEHIRRLS